jgi:2-aminoadipate transaminase
MPGPVAADSPASLPDLLSRRGRDLPMPRIGNPKDAASYISFVYGFPDAATLPNDSVLAATKDALAADAEWALQYGKTAGAPVLVNAIREKLRKNQGIVAGEDNILITAGSSQGIALILDLLVDWGDTVIVEAPTWMGFLYALRNVGGNAVSVPLDEHGTDVAALERELIRLRNEGVTPKFMYIISNFQNPTGISTTLERRKRIIELAKEFGTLILEDDAYYDLRFAGKPIPPIYALDDSHSTIYLSTLSKIMGAGMRLGWLVAPEEIVTRLSVLKIDGGTSVFGSHVAASWMPSYLDEHIEILKALYLRRRNLMLDALAKHMPEGTVWTSPDGGFFIWVTLPVGVDATRLLPQARERGVEYLPGATCFADGSGKNQLRLAFSFATDDQIEPGIKILAEVVAGELREIGQ